jgi:hypothetical protein
LAFHPLGYQRVDLFERSDGILGIEKATLLLYWL